MDKNKGVANVAVSKKGSQLSKEQKLSNDKLSKEQKIFNKLYEQITEEKEELLSWQTGISEFRAKYINELMPMQIEEDKLKIQMVYLLDEVYDDKALTKEERRTIWSLIEDIAQKLAGSDEKVKAIYNKRGRGDFDKEQEQLKRFEVEKMKSDVYELFNVDLGDIYIDSPEQFMSDFVKYVQEKVELDGVVKKPTRKKSAKTIAKELREAKQEQELSKSIKDVYRQLVKTLHPDREIDSSEQERKTELMQKVNAAYNKNDLLSLLQIQLEIEQIDHNAVKSISLEKVKHYNAILKRQLQEVRSETFFICESFGVEFNLPMLDYNSPDMLLLKLQRDINRITKKVKGLRSDLVTWKDKNTLKKCLKEGTASVGAAQEIIPWMLL